MEREVYHGIHHPQKENRVVHALKEKERDVRIRLMIDVTAE